MSQERKMTSGLPWLVDSIPSDWQVKRLKDIFEESAEVSITGEEDLLSVSEYYGVAKRKDRMTDEDEYETRADTLEGYKICHKGDLVSNIMLTWKRALGISEFEGIVSPAYAVYRGKDIFPKYYHYLLRSDMYIAEFKRNSKGIIESRLRLYSDRFFNIKTIYPPLVEQEKIARYLDEKITDIDAYIADRERELQLLKLFKRVKVDEVITRGLQTNVPMKDSGNPAIGLVPEHWVVKRFKSFARTIKGKSADYIDEPSGNSQVVLTVETLRSDNPQFYNYAVCDDPEQQCTPEDIIVIWDGAGVGEFLRAKEGLISSTTAKFTIEESVVLPRFFWYFGGRVEEIMKHMPTGMGIPHLNPVILANMEFAIPPLNEQQEIAKYLDEECQKVDKKCVLIGEQVARLQLLKRALINEVVVGKRRIQ